MLICLIMDILGKLFGSSNLVKILRLFLLNPEKIFENKEISHRSKVQAATLRREVSLLSKIGFICKKPGGKTARWQLNSSFPYLLAVKNLVLNADPLSSQQLLKKIKSVGKLKLVIVAGIFIQNDDSRVDLFVVGDSFNKNKMDNIVKDIESLVGKELVYAFFDTKDFTYRLGMYDKLVRDVLDYPHEKLLNKLDI